MDNRTLAGAVTPRRALAVLMLLAMSAVAVLAFTSRGEAQDRATEGTYYFKVTVDGHESSGYYKTAKFTGGGRSVVVDRTPDSDGEQRLQLSPGKLSPWTITLERGVDNNAELYRWFRQVRDGRVAAARSSVTIEIVDYKGDPVTTYALSRAWPRSYVPPGLNSGGNQILVEKIVLVAEDLERSN